MGWAEHRISDRGPVLTIKAPPTSVVHAFDQHPDQGPQWARLLGLPRRPKHDPDKATTRSGLNAL
ncbi:hypothetical protein ACFV90_15335 [Streptomyces sp. NPDC059904]|uniref:hypothetical protein n=1 Tax=Streptomyces sp. NPDC059904 TaxID=3346996 RepID=UPI003651F12A